MLDLTSAWFVNPSILRLGTGLALGVGIGIAIWGALVEQTGGRAVAETAFGVALGMFVAFPVWIAVGRWIRPWATFGFFRQLAFGTVLGIAFIALLSLASSVLTGRIGPESGILTGLLFPLILGIWNAALLGIGLGIGSAKS